MMTNDLVRQLDALNTALKRISDFLMPATDPRIFDAFRAFKVSSRNNLFCLRGISDFDRVRFKELRGIDDVIGQVRKNTEQFLRGFPCNNLLLYGPRGTGKSSVVKAVFNEYNDRGLRMIEMPRDTLFHLFDIAELLRGRHERFIVFCDDLSFEEDEGSYRQLKAVLEGGLETRPANMLIYATSNRRHLMPEKVSDNLPVRSDGELHPSETLEEKMSLSDRFGLRLGFFHFDLETYLNIALNYARLRKIVIDRDDLKRRATQWSLSHGSFSGRTARQFVDDLEGALLLDKNRV